MSEIRFDSLGPGDYDRAKAVLNKARHPGFVGRELFFRCATTGTVCVASVDDVDSGVLMIAKGKIQALSVITPAQGRGVGAALVTRFRPRWASVIGERVPWFEKLGYRPVGAPKVGQNGKHSTQLMELPEDAPAEEATIRDAPVARDASMSAGPSHSVVPFADMTPIERCEAQLAILDAALQSALTEGKGADVVKITDRARQICAEMDRRARELREDV